MQEKEGGMGGTDGWFEGPHVYLTGSARTCEETTRSKNAVLEWRAAKFGLNEGHSGI